MKSHRRYSIYEMEVDLGTLLKELHVMYVYTYIYIYIYIYVFGVLWGSNTFSGRAPGRSWADLLGTFQVSVVLFGGILVGLLGLLGGRKSTCGLGLGVRLINVLTLGSVGVSEPIV